MKLFVTSSHSFESNKINWQYTKVLSLYPLQTTLTYVDTIQYASKIETHTSRSGLRIPHRALSQRLPTWETRMGRQMICYPWLVVQIKTSCMSNYICNIGRYSSSPWLPCLTSLCLYGIYACHPHDALLYFNCPFLAPFTTTLLQMTWVETLSRSCYSQRSPISLHSSHCTRRERWRLVVRSIASVISPPSTFHVTLFLWLIPCQWYFPFLPRFLQPICMYRRGICGVTPT